MPKLVRGSDKPSKALGLHTRLWNSGTACHHACLRSPPPPLPTLAATLQPAALAPAEPQPAKKLSKHAKKRQKEERERAIHAAELRRLQGEVAPASEAEFQQLLLASPNSSYVWIKYMAFLISLGELDRARAEAERGLQTIDFREDSERFNVWVAYLNTENAYGSEDSTLAVLGRALTHTDARKLYLAAVDIFDRTDKPGLVEQCLKAMCRKFSCSVEVGRVAWGRAGQGRAGQGGVGQSGGGGYGWEQPSHVGGICAVGADGGGGRCCATKQTPLACGQQQGAEPGSACSPCARLSMGALLPTPPPTAPRHRASPARCCCCCLAQVWLRAVRYRLTQGDPEAAQKTLDRALQSLPRFEHVQMISQAGLLEFKVGTRRAWRH